MAQCFLRAGRRSVIYVSPRTASSSSARTAFSALFTTADTPTSTSTTPLPASVSAALAPNSSQSLKYSQPITRIIARPNLPPHYPSLLADGAPNTELYSISRTPSKFLPIYHEGKRGGNLKITSVKKVTGDIETLRKQLEWFLTPRPEYVRINPVNGHVVMKGWYKSQIENFLTAKGF